MIAERDGQAVGFALFFANSRPGPGGRGCIWKTCTSRRARAGGKALLIHLAGIARDRGWARFEWSVLDWNTPAIEFYRAMGAQAMGEWTVQRVSGEALAKLAGR